MKVFRFLLLSALASAANAAEPTLDEITVSANKIATPLLEVPATVSVITSEDSERRIDNDIKDLVRYEPNVSVRNNVARFGLSDFNVRGISGNRVLIEIDNVRLPDSFSIGSFSNAGRDGIDLELLKRVEIVRGSASSLFGSDAIGGVVALTTKDPSDLLGDRNVYAGARGTWGQAHESTGGSASLAGRLGRFSLLGVYSHQENGDYDNQGDVATPGATRTRPNPQDGYGDAVLLKGVFDVSDTQRLKLTVENSRHDLATDVVSSRTATPALDTTRLTGDDEDERRRVSLEHEFDEVGLPWLDGGVWRLYDQHSKTTQYTTENRTVRSAAGTSLRVRDRVFLFDQDLQGAEVTLHKTWDTGAVSQRVILGIEYLETDFSQLRGGVERNLTTGTSTSQVGPDLFPVRDFPNSTTRSTGVYLQDEVRAGRWIFSPALRFDRYELGPRRDPVFAADNPGVTPTALDDDHVSPKLGVVFQPLDDLALFASYNHGFRAPPYGDVNVGFTNLAGGYTTLPNPDLKPESSDNFEVGAKWAGDAARLDVSAFWNTYDDFIQSFATLGFNPGTGLLEFQSQNLDSVRIYGAELKALVPFGALQWQSAVGYAKGENRETGQPIDTVDPLRVVSGLSYRPATDTWQTGFSVTWVDAKSPLDPAVSQYLPASYTVVDVFGEVKLGAHLKLNAGVYNLFDEKYWDWADVRGRPANDVAIDRYTRPGRNVSASLKMEF
ncbi:MAG TPA: TonB-dependent hemoglobin/transferrin/lactoferrin family receptor [Steroidobacteraceae bacterium]|nr:TonB-dependent hemoglobin/transferrin/lactoferrin family receptor [Steroidobacteraceae bacterium]